MHECHYHQRLPVSPSLSSSEKHPVVCDLPVLRDFSHTDGRCGGKHVLVISS